MVAIGIVRASNANLHELGPGLVALFVGATSGIGESTAKAFVKNTTSPRVYIVGRSTTAAERIIEECRGLNKDGKVEFLGANVTELAEVDRVCKEIMKREKHINLLVQSQGNLNLKGRDESSEGLPRKMSLNIYSRMRFIHNLLPLLQNATNLPPHFARVVSILSGGREKPGALDTNDIELKQSYSGLQCSNHSGIMNSFMMEEFARRNPAIAFLHTAPGLVKTPGARELPFWARILTNALLTVLNPFFQDLGETGERQLFMATSCRYPPAKPSSDCGVAAGVPLVKGMGVAKGGAEVTGSGSYLVSWTGETNKNTDVIAEYRQQGVGKITYEHIIGIFHRVERLNGERKG